MCIKCGKLPYTRLCVLVPWMLCNTFGSWLEDQNIWPLKPRSELEHWWMLLAFIEPVKRQYTTHWHCVLHTDHRGEGKALPVSLCPLVSAKKRSRERILSPLHAWGCWGESIPWQSPQSPVLHCQGRNKEEKDILVLLVLQLLFSSLSGVLPVTRSLGWRLHRKGGRKAREWEKEESLKERPSPEALCSLQIWGKRC